MRDGRDSHEDDIDIVNESPTWTKLDEPEACLSVRDEDDFGVTKTEPTNDWRKGDTNETQNHDRGKGCSLVAVGDEFTHGQTITGVDTTRETDQDLE